MNKKKFLLRRARWVTRTGDHPSGPYIFEIATKANESYAYNYKFVALWISLFGFCSIVYLFACLLSLPIALQATKSTTNELMIRTYADLYAKKTM